MQEWRYQYATKAEAAKAYDELIKIMKASDEIMSDRRLNNEDYIFAQHTMDRAKDFMRSQEAELTELKDSIEMPSIELSRKILNKTATHILIDELRNRGAEVKGQSINDILEGAPSERKMCGCGGWPDVISPNNSIALYLVQCDRCHMETDCYDTKQEAIDAWNKAVGG